MHQIDFIRDSSRFYIARKLNHPKSCCNSNARESHLYICVPVTFPFAFACPDDLQQLSIYKLSPIAARRDTTPLPPLFGYIVSIAMSTEYQPGDQATILTFRWRPGPSTCQGLRLMSLIFRTQSARVALMSRERVRCPRGLCGIRPCGGRLGLPRDEGTAPGIGPKFAPAQAHANRTDNRKGYPCAGRRSVTRSDRRSLTFHVQRNRRFSLAS